MRNLCWALLQIKIWYMSMVSLLLSLLSFWFPFIDMLMWCQETFFTPHNYGCLEEVNIPFQQTFRHLLLEFRSALIGMFDHLLGIFTVKFSRGRKSDCQRLSLFYKDDPRRHICFLLASPFSYFARFYFQ